MRLIHCKSTCLDGRSLAVQGSISLTPTSKRGLITPHLLSLPFSSTTILPDLWSSTNSNSPMYPVYINSHEKPVVEILGHPKTAFNQGKERTVLLHNQKKLDNHFRRRPDHDLPFPPLLSIIHALQGIIQHTDSHHLTS